MGKDINQNQENVFENSLVELENDVLKAKEHLDLATSMLVILCRASEDDKHVNNQALSALNELNKVDKILRN